MKVLDVGSGTEKCNIARGNVCIDLCKRPENKPSNFICADAHYLPFKAETFERINMFEVIEHVENPIRCLREIWRTLKSDGSLKVSTPNVFHWRIILRQIRGQPKILSDTGHIACWSEAEFENILVSAKFSNIRFEYTTLPLPLALSTHKTLDKIARAVLPAPISGTNIVASAIKH